MTNNDRTEKKEEIDALTLQIYNTLIDYIKIIFRGLRFFNTQYCAWSKKKKYC